MAAVILHDHAGIINLRIKVAGIRPAIPGFLTAIANEGDASVIQACHAAAMGVGRGGISGAYIDACLAVLLFNSHSVKIQAIFRITAKRDPGNVRAKPVDSGHSAYIRHVVGVSKSGNLRFAYLAVFNGSLAQRLILSVDSRNPAVSVDDGSVRFLIRIWIIGRRILRIVARAADAAAKLIPGDMA